MFIVALFTIAKIRRQPKCPLTDEEDMVCVCVCVCVSIYIYHIFFIYIPSLYIYHIYTISSLFIHLLMNMYLSVYTHTHTQWNATQP